MVYKNILIASGGAEHSRKAEKRAVEMAKAFGSSLTLVSVARSLLPVSAYGGGLDMGVPVVHINLVNDQKARQEIILKEACSRCEEQGLKPVTLVLSGNAGEQIVEKAKQLECNLIVVGSRNLSIMGAITQGSVSDYVMRHAHCDVLIAR